MFPISILSKRTRLPWRTRRLLELPKRDTETCRLRRLSQSRIGFHTRNIETQPRKNVSVWKHYDRRLITVSELRSWPPTRNCINCTRRAPLNAIMVVKVRNPLTNRFYWFLFHRLSFSFIPPDNRGQKGRKCVIHIWECNTIATTHRLQCTHCAQAKPSSPPQRSILIASISTINNQSQKNRVT